MNVFLIVFILSILLLIATVIFYLIKKNKKTTSSIFSGVTGSVELPKVIVSNTGVACFFIDQNKPDLVINSGNIPDVSDINIWSASKDSSNFDAKNTTGPYIVKLDADASGDLIMYDSKNVVVWKASTSGLPFTSKNMGGPYKLTVNENYVYIYDSLGNHVWSTDESVHSVMHMIQKNNMELTVQQQDFVNLLNSEDINTQIQQQQLVNLPGSVNMKPQLQQEVSDYCSMLPNRSPIQSGTKSIYDTPSRTYPCAINNQLEQSIANVNFQPPLF